MNLLARLLKVDKELMLKFFRVTILKIAGWCNGVRIIFQVTQKSERETLEVVHGFSCRSIQLLRFLKALTQPYRRNRHDLGGLNHGTAVKV